MPVCNWVLTKCLHSLWSIKRRFEYDLKFSHRVHVLMVFIHLYPLTVIWRKIKTEFRKIFPRFTSAFCKFLEFNKKDVSIFCTPQNDGKSVCQRISMSLTDAVVLQYLFKRYIGLIWFWVAHSSQALWLVEAHSIGIDCTWRRGKYLVLDGRLVIFWDRELVFWSEWHWEVSFYQKAFDTDGNCRCKQFWALKAWIGELLTLMRGKIMNFRDLQWQKIPKL